MDISSWKELVKKLTIVDKILALFLILGVVILIGSLFRGIGGDDQVQVEYLTDEKMQEAEEILVDVGGAVVSPGVYKLLKYSRVKDALIAAGGLAAEADREFVSTTINLAEVINDGQKIYIPKMGIDGSGEGYSEPKNGSGKININKASESDLDTLEGIGSARAAKIIEGRPYGKIEDLVSKEVLSQSIFDKIKDKIAIF